MRRLVHLGALLAFLLSGGVAHSTASQDQTDPDRQSAGVPNDPGQGAEGAVAFERSDCILTEAVCRSECAYHADEKRCIVRRCDPLFLQCTASLPVGKVVSLPAACVTADREAVRRLERQGELLDADPALFAESFNTLVRARISCRAGYFTEALNFYDEIQESLREKRVQDNEAMRVGR